MGFREHLKKRIVDIPLIIVALVAVFSWLNSKGEAERLFTELEGQKEKYVQLSEHAAKLETQYVSEKELRETLEKEWASEKDALEGRLKLLSNATFLIREKARETNNSDLVYAGEGVKYVYNELRFHNGPPIGYVLIFDDGRVVSKIYNHTIEVKTAVSRDEDSGTYDVVSKADFVLKSAHLQPDGINWYKKPYSLKISGGVAKIDPTEPVILEKKIQWWAPNLNGGFNIGLDVKPALGLSIAGYGVSDNDLDWKFLHFGMDYTSEDGLGLHLIPVLYRPFPKVLRNTYFGPGIGSDQSLFLGVNIGF